MSRYRWSTYSIVYGAGQKTNYFMIAATTIVVTVGGFLFAEAFYRLDAYMGWGIGRSYEYSAPDLDLPRAAEEDDDI